MLDVITDFWKPVKKNGHQEKPDLDNIQVGSIVEFGNVPQTLISGRRLKVSNVNTYQFGEERMTSYVLSQEKDDSVSLIVASIEGDQYLALSRRIPFADRMRMFDPSELEAIVEQQDATKLQTREIDATWKNWLVGGYQKEISGLRGAVTKGDYRDRPSPSQAVMQLFDYVLLTSDNNEYAIEIERYADGRLELYATIYRRVSDIVELDNPQQTGEPRKDIAPVLETNRGVAKEEKEESASVVSSQPTLSTPQPPIQLAKSDSSAPSVKPVTATPVPAPSSGSDFSSPARSGRGPLPHPGSAANKTSPVAETSAPAVASPTPPAKPEEPKPVEKAETPVTAEASKEKEFVLTPPGQSATPKVEENAKPTAEAPAKVASEPKTTTPVTESKPMQTTSNGSTAQTERTASAPAFAAPSQPAPSTAHVKQEIVAVKPQRIDQENEAIECDLKIANRIIDEAIRNEMRLSDVVRRVIALPVANPEAVQIPITLTDSDYQLLAIRYGVAPNDRDAVKKRIIEELNDFSGSNK